MRAKVFSIVSILGLVLALPLAAQVPEEDNPQQDPQQVTEEQQLQEPVEPVEPEQSEEPAETTGDQQEAEQSSERASEQAAEGDIESDEDMERLPKTASPLALLALIGAGGLGSAAFLRSRRRS